MRDSKYGLMLFMLHFISRRKLHRQNDKRLESNLIMGFPNSIAKLVREFPILDEYSTEFKV